VAGPTADSWTVAKVGGSLFDLHDLDIRLSCWLQNRRTPVLVVAGGGKRADKVRRFQSRHAPNQSTAHWLAVRAMTRNARELVRLLGERSTIVDGWDRARKAWQRCLIPVLDAWSFLRADEREPGKLPHSWDVTSDSIAARVAVRGGAGRLVLLKSTDLPGPINWQDAGNRGLVDRHFATTVGSIPSIEWVNLRAG
jgi:aspartokinase-like uncharacterized kinase